VRRNRSGGEVARSKETAAMKRIYAFLCETNLVWFFAAFDAAVFARLARRQAFKPRSWRLLGLFGYALAAVFLLLTSAVFFLAAEHLYLDRYGTDAVGTVTGRTFYTYTERHGSKTRKETVTYEFTTPQGRTVKNSIDQPVSALSGLATDNRITVAYSPRFPILNAPRGVRWAIDEMMVLWAFLLFFDIVCFRLARSQIAWAKSLSTQPAQQ
jgi:hypothetical protein